MKRVWRLAIGAAGLLAATVLATACATVEPWERSAFADPLLRRDRDPLRDALTEHIYFSREATAGGRDVGGGGCGCN